MEALLSSSQPPASAASNTKEAEKPVKTKKKAPKPEPLIQAEAPVLHSEPEPAAPAPAPKEEVEESTKADAPKESTTTTSNDKGPLFVVEAHHETEEVLERLLDVKALNENISGLWGWMQGSASKVVETANQVKEQAVLTAAQVQEQAVLTAAQVQEQAALTAAQVKEQAALAATSLSKQMEEKPVPVAVVAAPLPWESVPAERRAEAKDRIIKLSMEDQTFTVPPPKEAAFQYDAALREATAHRLLEVDALLGAKRFKLVPKTVVEVDFWRNYFYRVDLIINAIGASSSSSSKSEPAATTKSPQAAAAVAAITAASLAQQELDDEIRKELAEDVADNFDMLDDDDLEFDDEELARELQ